MYQGKGCGAKKSYFFWKIYIALNELVPVSVVGNFDGAAGVGARVPGPLPAAQRVILDRS